MDAVGLPTKKAVTERRFGWLTFQSVANRPERILDLERKRGQWIPPVLYPLFTAEFAKALASVLCSRGIWDIENPSDRASLRQVQLRE